MANITLTPPAPHPLRGLLARGRGVWLASAGILIGLAIFVPGQASDTLRSAGASLWGTAPFLLASVLLASWLVAVGADNLIARAFAGSPLTMVAIAAAAGALSPFCSCGVIPLVAALLSMGVPLSAVMAFWLASPIMDPEMFVMTAGLLSLEFALAKTLAAIGLGLLGGFTVHMLARRGALADPLRPGIGNGGCGGSNLRAPKPVVWRFWADPVRRAKFLREALTTTLFLTRWLVLAFILESLILAFVPADSITRHLGGTGFAPIVMATLVGVPAYLNGYAALPLVGGLMEQGMAPGAGMAFLVAGGVTSIPAAMAVWALVRPRVFGLYLLLSLAGALLCGVLFQLWSGL